MFIKSHSGIQLTWKIDCDSLTNEDLDTLAYIVSKRYYFGSVVGVSTGGIRFANVLQEYITAGPRLIVDDVLTTGKSMEEFKKSDTDIGVVIFSRNIFVPKWIRPIFKFDWDRVYSI